MSKRSDIQVGHNQEKATAAQACEGAQQPHSLSSGNCLSGASPSNTAPPNCTKLIEGTKVLRTGVDSLYLSYRGLLNPESEEMLLKLKMLAQSEDPEDKAKAVYELNDHHFEVKDKGKGRFPFVLVDNWYHLQVSRSSSQAMPMLYVQVASEILSRSGVRPSVINLTSVAMRLGKLDGLATVSRVDLCVDFVTNQDLTNLPRNSWVTRANLVSTHYEKNEFTGYTFGMGGRLSCRLYNKTLEIEKSGKDYFFPLWAEGGWDGESTVWRLEYQFKREILNEIGIRSVQDLQDKKGSLWSLANDGWLRLTLPLESDQTKSRWPNHPVWQILSNAPWGGDRDEPLYRSRKTRPPSEQHLFINGIGAITSFMALKGITGFDEGMAEFQRAAHDYHLRVRFPKTEKTLGIYAREKAAEKGRRFNTNFDGVESGTSAKAYRKAKEGE